MRRSLVVACILQFFFALTFAADSNGATQRQNSLRTDRSVTVYKEAPNGIPEFVRGNLSAAAARGNEVSTALGFFEQHRQAYRMVDPAGELAVDRIDKDRLGMSHCRFQQQYRGLKVNGGDLVAHFTADGQLVGVNGYYRPGIDLDTQPSISGTAATAAARTDLASNFGPAKPTSPELVVFPWNDRYYLAWQMYLLSDNPPGRWEYLIDARTGDVIYRANRIKTESMVGTGTGVMGDPRNHLDVYYDGAQYYLIDYSRQADNNIHGHDGQMPAGRYIKTNIAGLTLPGATAIDLDNVWDAEAQAAAVDGHTYTALVYDWLLSEFNRNSYSGDGDNMLVIVDYRGAGTDNAYWDGRRIVVWDHSYVWRSLAGCPDVIAHEWGHAVTDYASNLRYEKESGALNESFSDMMGAAFEFAHDSMDAPDWYMAENGVVDGNGLRNMANPREFFDPDFYGSSDPFWVPVAGCSPNDGNDYCGVHTNSGVGNKWFYLLSEGGSHHGVTVEGIGVNNAIHIAYRANLYYWTSTTGYQDAALSTVAAADDLDPTGVWSQQVREAWRAVGITMPQPRLAFDFPLGIPLHLESGFPTTVNVTVSGLWDAIPLSGTGQLHYSIDGSPYQAVNMTQESLNNYSAVIPPAGCSSTVNFYFSARQSSGERVYYPDTTHPFSPEIASEVFASFEDDFETDLTWTVYGDAADGHWIRGVPAGSGVRGDPQHDFDGSGSCYLTGNAEGDSDVDAGTTNLVSPLMDLGEGDAKISYARWFSNSAGENPNSDVMNVWISNDSGDSWVQVEQVGPVEQADGNWYLHSFWVSDFVAPTSRMLLRFEVSDLGDESVVEAAVDAISINRFDCADWLCGDLTNDGRVTLADITLLIGHVYLGGPPPVPLVAGNVDASADGKITLSDVTTLIDHVYISHNPLNCL